ncbi:hypothetical protein AV530_009968 [Patagioenas fasciata monilis]|uniref:Uncharacterized protein n=1 Tax=Patagioenas fasciata monilis TaxID=372326 RepID=A0A1V4KB11_PATFA|nr:hypothetical protein AV530_009968 [Patagioenas fasciata monilis]
MCRRGPGPGSVWSWCLRRPHPSPLWPCPPQPAAGTAGGVLRPFPEPLSGGGSRVCPPSRVPRRARPAALSESGCLEKGQNAGSAVCSDNRGTPCPEWLALKLLGNVTVSDQSKTQSVETEQFMNFFPDMGEQVFRGAERSCLL